MKQIIAIIGLLTISLSHVQAQKWMTRTGKVSFFSSTPVENIEAFNNEAACVVESKNGEVVFIVPIKSFRFEKALMQEHFNENYMESDKFPKAQYKGKITNIQSLNFSKDGSYQVNTQGKLTIHGVTRDVTVPGTIIISGGVATIKTKFMVAPADYGIKIPSITASKIASNIEITINAQLKETK
jgi:polyisoprenoid-binding protein YceI